MPLTSFGPDQLAAELTILGSLPLLIVLITTPLIRSAFSRLQILDVPDGIRRVHKKAVPRVGGIPIALSYIVTLAILPAIGGAHLPPGVWLVGGLITGSAVVFLTGLADDLFGLTPGQKLLGQLIAAGLVCAAGVRISSLGGLAVPAWAGFPLTLAWLALCTNAFNLIDGLDGLASGMGLFATTTMLIAALASGNHALALATVPLTGSLLGFMRYNFNPASVFLGDSGSLLIGFLLGSYAVIWSQKTATVLGLAAPAMTLAVPLLDTFLSVARRWLRGQPVFGGDRSHIHHKLLERGLTHRNVVLLLYLVTALCAGLSLIQSLGPDRIAVATVVLFSIGIYAGVDRLGYLEFQGLRRALTAKALRRSIRGEVAIQAIERRIQAAASVDSCWEAVRDASNELGFSQTEANLEGRFFRHEPGGYSTLSWQLRVPLGETNYVQVGRQLTSGAEPASLAPFVDLLRTTLLPRLTVIRDFGETSRPNGASQLKQRAESLHFENKSSRKPVHS